MPYKVLIVGGGGREHALYDVLGLSPRVSEIICTPGNGGIPASARRSVKADNLSGLLALARAELPDLIVVGPEAPLVAGIQDIFSEAGFAVFGPSRAAAQLEGSKAYCKQLCVEFGIPTAEYREVHLLAMAQGVIEQWGAPIVVKDDGLAAGKGVKVADTVSEALEFVDMLFKSHKSIWSSVVIERKLEGRECSIMALCDGAQAVLLAPARDYKRAYDGDQGDNTGGMGAYSPLPDVDDALLARIKKEIVDKLVAAMAKRGHPYHGVLYAGIMLTKDGPMLLEVNCRFGDPETQVVLPRLKSDLFPYLMACTTLGGLSALPPPEWNNNTAVGVVMTSGGYPGSHQTGYPIRGLQRASAHEEVRVYHAGTEFNPGKGVVTSGGRVLSVVGFGRGREMAAAQAYRSVQEILFAHERHRSDIGD